MRHLLIIGSGPAAAAAAMAATGSRDTVIEIIDPGENLEASKRTLLESVASIEPSAWPDHVQAELTQRPVVEVRGELPQKRLFGSNYPFRDRGQLAGLQVASGANRYTVSAAFGGFSNVWGAQVLPFTAETIGEWPIDYGDLAPHYRRILEGIPFSGADDDYSELFPLFAAADPLPRLSPAAARVLQRYRSRRDRVRARGVTVGEARLALRAAECIECGLCLTGCPYGLIYSASQTISDLLAKPQVSRSPGLLALRVGEDDAGPWALVREVRSGETRTIRADRIFLACGGIGTTRLVLGSARPHTRRLMMEESAQLVLPFVSLFSQPDPRTYRTFTLNQISMLVGYGRQGLDLAHFHLYPYNPAFDEALPSLIARFPRLTTTVLRRTVASLGYLPSWASPQIQIDVTNTPPDSLPSLSISAAPNPRTRSALARVFAKLISVAPLLDLWPVIPALSISGPAKSYHYGGSFPHVRGEPRPGEQETDTLGRLAEWRRVHLIDGSVFPSVPATTFTLTVMANAHRIATAALDAGGG